MALFCNYEKVFQLLESGQSINKLEQYSSEIQSLSLQINDKRKKREALYEDFAESLISIEIYTELKKRYDSEYQGLNQHLKEVQQAQYKLNSMLSGKSTWALHMRTLTEAKEFNQDLMEALVDKVLVYHSPDGKRGERRIEIQYKFARHRAALDEACAELLGGGKQ